MTTTKDNADTLPMTERNAAEPFEIRFSGKPYFLTYEDLLLQGDSDVADKRRWCYPNMEIISLEGRTIKMRVKAMQRRSQCLTLQVTADSLHVSCDCGMTVQKLCVHALKALERIVTYEDNKEWYFDSFRPGGTIDTGREHPEFFKPDLKTIHYEFTAKKHKGGVYVLGNEKNLNKFENMLDLPGPSVMATSERCPPLAYMIMYVGCFRLTVPPFLVPCLGVFNKAGTEIKSYLRFLSGPSEDYGCSLTVHEKLLNDLCREMWECAKTAHCRLMDTDKANRVKLNKLFDLWEQALPYLRQQEFVYYHPLYRIVDLEGRPIKKYTRPIKLGRERPKLCFLLADKGAYYQLDLKVSIGAKVVALVNGGLMFFIRNEDHYYLVSSLMDAGVLAWMGQMNNSLVIFKEHFEEFEKSYLNPLKQNYSIKMV